MSAREYRSWQDAAEWANRTCAVDIPSVCHDCTFAFRLASRRAGICNTQARLEQMEERREKVAALRREGKTWRQIGQILGIGAGKARDSIRYHRDMLESAA